jgi:hypothetical protein
MKDIPIICMMDAFIRRTMTIMTNINYRSAPRIRRIARRVFAPGITNRTVTSVFPMVIIVTSYMQAGCTIRTAIIATSTVL